MYMFILMSFEMYHSLTEQMFHQTAWGEDRGKVGVEQFQILSVTQ